VVGRIGVGLDNLDLRALSDRGIVVCYPPEENAVSVSEHVFALLLSFARHIPAADRSVRAGRWERGAYIGFELAGSTMGILGLGRIGFRVAVRARAFGMRVLAYDPTWCPSTPRSRRPALSWPPWSACWRRRTW
jgi:D-3-phosphoglycerate dehydrogenase